MWQDDGMRLSPAPALFVLVSLSFLALLALALAPASGLNHFYVVLDHDTYAAIEQSAFLTEQFAVFEKRTTVRADKTYSGIYFYGRQTYLEFLEPSFLGPSGDRQTGDSGIAFGGDAAIEPIENLKPMTITREWNGVKVPWFSMTTPSWESQNDRFLTWYMTYHPDFLAQWHPEARPSGAASPQVSRAAVLERYKAALPAASSSSLTRPTLMEDVSGLTLALKAESRPRFEAWTKAIGAAFQLRFVDPGAGIEGIRAAELRLGRAPAGLPDKEETLRFGSRSTLTLRQDRTATWRFE